MTLFANNMCLFVDLLTKMTDGTTAQVLFLAQIPNPKATVALQPYKRYQVICVHDVDLPVVSDKRWDCPTKVKDTGALILCAYHQRFLNATIRTKLFL